jgi:hypothetical protein
MRSRDARATTAGLLFIAATATSLIATAFPGSLSWKGLASWPRWPCIRTGC